MFMFMFTHTPTKPQRSIYADQTTDMWTFFKNRQIFYVLSFRRVNTGPNYTSCIFRHFIQNMNITSMKHVQCALYSRQQVEWLKCFEKLRFLCVCLYKLFVFLAGLALKIERWASFEGRLSLNILIFYRQSQERGIL